MKPREWIHKWPVVPFDTVLGSEKRSQGKCNSTYCNIICPRGLLLRSKLGSSSWLVRAINFWAIMSTLINKPLGPRLLNWEDTIEDHWSIKSWLLGEYPPLINKPWFINPGLIFPQTAFPHPGCGTSQAQPGTLNPPAQIANGSVGLGLSLAYPDDITLFSACLMRFRKDSWLPHYFFGFCFFCNGVYGCLWWILCSKVSPICQSRSIYYHLLFPQSPE